MQSVLTLLSRYQSDHIRSENGDIVRSLRGLHHVAMFVLKLSRPQRHAARKSLPARNRYLCSGPRCPWVDGCGLAEGRTHHGRPSEIQRTGLRTSNPPSTSSRYARPVANSLHKLFRTAVDPLPLFQPASICLVLKQWPAHVFTLREGFWVTSEASTSPTHERRSSRSTTSTPQPTLSSTSER